MRQRINHKYEEDKLTVNGIQSFELKVKSHPKYMIEFVTRLKWHQREE